MGTGTNTELISQSSTLLPQTQKQAIFAPKVNGSGSSTYKNRNGHGLEIEEASNSQQPFVSDITANHKQINLGFHDISYVVPEPNTTIRQALLDERPMKTIMHGVSGEFKAGELTAIMGQSGSGKTTLLNILAGYKTSHGGTVLVNGNPRNLSRFRKQSCYIMQDDILLPHLTVLESMTFAAQLKLPVKSTKSQISNRVSQILQTIGIHDCLDTRACQLSGGERKRLSIALELITNPEVLLLDEPTSGLDSASCYSCVALLKSLAREGGRNIIATIHQPSAKIFEVFDSLYLLADGHCLYQGPTKSLVPFLESQSLSCPVTYNPADFALDVASGEYGKDSVIHLREVTATLFKMSTQGGSLSSSGTSSVNGEVACPNGNFMSVERSSDGDSEETMAERMDKKAGKTLHQFMVLLKRSWYCIARDKMLNHIRLGSTLIVAVLLGIIYRGHGSSAVVALNNCGGIFFLSLFVMFSSLMATILTFPLEREVIVKEHLNCWYSLKTYYAARSLADMPFQIFFPLVFTSVTYLMMEQPLELFRFSIVCVMVLLLSLICQAFGLFYGSFCSIETCVFIAPISTIPFVLFNGLFTDLNSIPFYIRWFAYISYAKYTIQPILYAIYGYDREDLHCDQAYCIFKEPHKVLEEINADEVNVPLYGLIAFTMLIVLRIMAYLGLRYKIASMKQ